MISGAARLAWRNLWRNKRRTALAVLGIGIGCAVALILTGFRRSVTEIYSRVAAESGPGHVRISPRGWLPQRDERLRLEQGAEVVERLRHLSGVAVVAPRARAQGLLAMGTRVAGVELTGVDPLVEQRACRFVRTVVAGRWLVPSDDDGVVLGKALAARLRVEPDDLLVVTVVGRGSELESAMLRVVGVVSTGSRELDLGIAHVNLPALERLTGLVGPGEIAVMLDDFELIPGKLPALAAAAGPNVALRWDEVSAALAGHLKQDEAMSRVMSGIILLVVLLGVASAQLSSVLERRKEFAVFAALGMRPWRLVVQMFLEAALQGVVGSVAGLVLAAPALWYLSTTGLNLAALVGGELTFEGILMDPILYARIGPWMVLFVFQLAMASTLFGAIYPALYAARTDPATALRSAA